MELGKLLLQVAPIMLHGTGYTLIFAFTSMIFGLLLGILLAIARITPSRFVQWPALIYISIVRGTPLLVQIFVIYYGLPSLDINLSPLIAGILTLSLNAAAYFAESLRGAILSVAHDQWQASYSLGLNFRQTISYIIVPQAIYIAIPSISNTSISLIKDTSLVSIIAVTELMLSTKEIIAVVFRPLPLYITAAFIYWMLSLSVEFLQHRLESCLRRYYH